LHRRLDLQSIRGKEFRKPLILGLDIAVFLERQAHSPHIREYPGVPAISPSAVNAICRPRRDRRGMLPPFIRLFQQLVHFAQLHRLYLIGNRALPACQVPNGMAGEVVVARKCSSRSEMDIQETNSLLIFSSRGLWSSGTGLALWTPSLWPPTNTRHRGRLFCPPRQWPP
jgi:hypothetical protein